MVNKQTAFSGIQPTGALHIGNYLGAIKQWLELQETHHCIFCIVDYHAITVPYESKEMPNRIFETALDYFALGLDPKKSIIFVQSHVPEHTELAWILNTIVPIGELERMTQYKEKTKEQHSSNAGLINYPVLMAADILLYKTHVVPVGEDQQQHVELTRTIARKFNAQFGGTFIVPKAQLSQAQRIMSLADPTKKMSKSLGPKHYLALTDTPETIREKVSRAVTDTGSEGREMSSALKNLFRLLKEFGTPAEIKKFEAAYSDKTIRYVALKETLAGAIIRTLTPFQKERASLAKEPEKIWNLLNAGDKKAKPIAQKTLKEVKQKMGLI